SKCGTKGKKKAFPITERLLYLCHDVWGSIGVSENVIEASWDALVDSLEYAIQPGRARAGGTGSGGATRAAT
ncbi:MAG TPA: hypothetical protein VFG31_04735, partial [Conexibacter sp.]|nr:hypothetical protein [Conexibacter sp.]